MAPLKRRHRCHHLGSSQLCSAAKSLNGLWRYYSCMITGIWRILINFCIRRLFVELYWNENLKSADGVRVSTFKRKLYYSEFIRIFYLLSSSVRRSAWSNRFLIILRHFTATNFPYSNCQNSFQYNSNYSVWFSSPPPSSVFISTNRSSFNIQLTSVSFLRLGMHRCLISAISCNTTSGMLCVTTVRLSLPPNTFLPTYLFNYVFLIIKCIFDINISPFWIKALLVSTVLIFPPPVSCVTLFLR